MIHSKYMPEGRTSSYIISEKDYTIPTFSIAQHPFRCIVCGTWVKIGDACLNDDGKETCLCMMPVKPERKLIPVADYQLSKI